MTTKKLIIYHGSCPDGFASAWVCTQALGAENCELYAARFGDDPPSVKGREVYIVDFSYKRDALQQMHADADSLWVLDHHQTAEDDLEGLSYCKFDMNESGATMAWKHFYPQAVKQPWLVQYVRDRDLWKFELPDSKEVAAYVMAQPHDLDVWTAMAHMNVRVVTERGRAIRQHIDNYIESRKHSAFTVELDGIAMRCVNAPFNNISDLLHEMCDATIPAAIGFFWRGDGWQYSLRSIGELDITPVATSRGGGGHRNAAGFESGRVLIPEIADALATAERCLWETEADA